MEKLIFGKLWVRLGSRKSPSISGPISKKRGKGLLITLLAICKNEL